MKKTLLILLILIGVGAVSGYTVPDEIALEILHTNASTGAVLVGTYEMNFSIYDDASRSTLLCSELQNVTFDANGLAGILFTCTDDFNEDTYLCIDDTGDDDETTGCMQLGSVPYAKYSEISLHTDGGNIAGGTITADIDGNSFNITDLTFTSGTTATYSGTVTVGTLTDSTATLTGGVFTSPITLGDGDDTITINAGTSPFNANADRFQFDLDSTNVDDEIDINRNVGAGTNPLMKLKLDHVDSTNMVLYVLSDADASAGAVIAKFQATNAANDEAVVEIANAGSNYSILLSGTTKSISDGTGLWSSGALSGFSAISGTTVTGTTLTDGSLSINSGAITSLASITDSTATWSSSALSGFSSISGTTLTDGTLSINSGAITSLASISDGTATWSSSNLAGFGNIDITGDATFATLTMTGFLVDADGDVRHKTVMIGATTVINADPDIINIVNIDGSGDLTVATVTMTGFSIDGSGDVVGNSFTTTGTTDTGVLMYDTVCSGSCEAGKLGWDTGNLCICTTTNTWEKTQVTTSGYTLYTFTRTSTTGASTTGSDGDAGRILTLGNSALTANEIVYVDRMQMIPTTDYAASHLSSSSTITFVPKIYDSQKIVVIYGTVVT